MITYTSGRSPTFFVMSNTAIVRFDLNHHSNTCQVYDIADNYAITFFERFKDIPKDSYILKRSREFIMTIFKNAYIPR